VLVVQRFFRAKRTNLHEKYDYPELAQALRARVVSIAGAGHSLMAEAPDALLQALRDALR
jgi:pimeloyl-ACP methyl ester carboxylesterase